MVGSLRWSDVVPGHRSLLENSCLLSRVSISICYGASMIRVVKEIHKRFAEDSV